MLTTLEKNSIAARSELFARIKPIVGDALFERKVVIFGKSQMSLLMDYLVCCGVTNFELIESSDQVLGRISDKAELPLVKALESISDRLELKINSQTWQPRNLENLVSQNFDLIIASGNYETFQQVKDLVKQSGKTGIFYFIAPNGSGLVIFLLPNRPIELPKELFSDKQPDNPFTQLHLSNVVANYAKGLLLKGTKFARLDIESVVNNHQMLLVGHTTWPWAIKAITSLELPALFGNLQNIKHTIPNLRGKKYLVIGLGSLGSIIADSLLNLGASLTLVDGEKVESANPIRQLYRVSQIGMPKVNALAQRLNSLSQEIFSIDKDWPYKEQTIISCEMAISPDNLEEFEKLIELYKPDVAVVATGTGNDRIISQSLFARQIPHVVVSCYARARFFEAIVVDGKGSPCFGCMRGHLYLGKTPSLTPEQKARYVSTDNDLAAEPATRIETGRAADLATHIAYGLMNLDDCPWLARALREEQTFFLGGNTAETQNGEWAYTIEQPSEVKLFGLSDITGRGDYIECWDCGRKLSVQVEMTNTNNI